MLKQILDYEITVDDVEENGHSIKCLEMTLQGASETFDRLKERFPNDTIRCFCTERKEIFRSEGKPKQNLVPICPRGCFGTRDGRPVVVRTEGGKVQCGICGYLGD